MPLLIICPDLCFCNYRCRPFRSRVLSNVQISTFWPSPSIRTLRLVRCVSTATTNKEEWSDTITAIQWRHSGPKRVSSGRWAHSDFPRSYVLCVPFGSYRQHTLMNCKNLRGKLGTYFWQSFFDIFCIASICWQYRNALWARIHSGLFGAMWDSSRLENEKVKEQCTGFNFHASDTTNILLNCRQLLGFESPEVISHLTECVLSQKRRRKLSVHSDSFFHSTLSVLFFVRISTVERYVVHDFMPRMSLQRAFYWLKSLFV